MSSTVFIDQCPACKRTLKIDTAVSGPFSRCPACGAVLKVMAPPKPTAKRAKMRDQVSEEAMGVLALWICGVGAIVAIGSIVGVLAVGLGKKSATPATTPIPVVQRPVPPTAQSNLPPPSQRMADPNLVPVARGTADPNLTDQPDAPSWPVLSDTQKPREPSDLPANDANDAQEKTGEPEAVAAIPPPAPVQEPARPVKPGPQAPATPPPSDSGSAEPVPTELLARLVGARADIFSHRDTSGRVPVLWRPAPMGRHYVFFTISVRNPTQDATQLFFDSRASARAIKLTNPSGESATMLGRLLPAAAPPRQFDITPLDLAGREEVSDLVIAFIVPTHWRDGTLDGPGFTTGQIRLPVTDGEPVSPDDVVGWWRRTPDQPMRVRYVNPVLDALAESRVERMLLNTDGRAGLANMFVPFAEIAGDIQWPSGQTKSVTAEINLRRGGSALSGYVRFADRGNVLVVYASDAPYEQIIYHRDLLQ